MKFNKNPSDGSNSADYLKIEPGGSVVGIFQGNPFEYYGKWENRKLSLCDEGEEGAKFRFSVNFVTKEGESYVPKVWDGGARVYNQLKALNEDYPLDKTVVKISRQGSGTNTTYNILPLPNGHAVKPETAKVLSGVQLYTLSELVLAKSSSSSNEEIDNYLDSQDDNDPNWPPKDEPLPEF